MLFTHSKPQAVYVIAPRSRMVDPVTHITTPVHGIRAEFVNHQFDSEAAAKVYKWDEQTRLLVERKLVEHEDFNRPPSTSKSQDHIYLADHPGAKVAITESGGLEVTDPIKPCLFAINDRDGTRMCDQPAVLGNHCMMHAQAVLDAQKEADRQGSKVLTGRVASS